MSLFKRYLLMTIGFTSIALGIAGILLPLLPTTPFLILALACFARSSERFYQQLLNHRYAGPLLADWVQHRKIERQRKQQIMLFVVCSFCISIVMLWGMLPLQLMLVTLMLVLLFFIYRIGDR